MQPHVARTELSVGYGASRGWRVVSVLLVGAMLTVGCGCLGALLGHGLVAATGGGDRVLPGLCALLLAGLTAILVGIQTVVFVRSGARLEGSRLTVTTLTSRSVDLRTARMVSLHATAGSNTGVSSDGTVVAIGGGTRTPVLTVTTGEGTVSTRLRSRDGVLIPAPEMRALAAALDTARCPGAAEAAGWLRAMAADPHTMLL
ncbi:hypothetical protein V6U81_17015 [Micromonospora sp. CPCC 205711]|uniref:hypothetical protein n=1 Tax=Micromonospora sp. CPCC 205547 TaxID=3122400 RepID=UPI002FF36729